METRKKNILLKKSEAFATRIVKLYQYLINEKHETVISKQIYRSGTSIGANVAESEHAQSGIDFTHKLSISLKEANETRYWLNTLHNSNYIDDTGFNSMKEDVEELIRILVSSIKTMKRKNDPAISIQ